MNNQSEYVDTGKWTGWGDVLALLSQIRESEAYETA
jgi:hypothetical protein